MVEQRLVRPGSALWESVKHVSDHGRDHDFRHFPHGASRRELGSKDCERVSRMVLPRDLSQYNQHPLSSHAPPSLTVPRSPDARAPKNKTPPQAR